MAIKLPVSRSRKESLNATNVQIASRSKASQYAPSDRGLKNLFNIIWSFFGFALTICFFLIFTQILDNIILKCTQCFVCTFYKIKINIYNNIRGNLKKEKSIFKDIIQIKVDHPPSYPIFDKLFFDKF